MLSTKKMKLKTAGVKILMSILLILSATSCDNSFIFDQEGDCSLHYRLRFVYDMNLKWADAFPSEVKSVRVYVFDQDEKKIAEYIRNGATLSDPDFAIDLDLPEGNYHLVAWCGIDNEGITNQSFTAPQEDNLTLRDLYCKLNRKSDERYPAYSDQHLQFMYYGSLDVSIKESDDKGGGRYYTMPLVKDTNHLRVELIQLSGEPTDADKFTFSIEATNGLMDYQNNLIGSTVITYLPWHKSSDAVEVSPTPGTTLNTLSAVADLDLSRMTVEQKKQMLLTIRNSATGETVASVPIIDYALLAKDYYEFAYGHEMSDQEFLDREDEYVMTFFLDQNMRWINSYIYINSWRIVLHEYGL